MSRSRVKRLAEPVPEKPKKKRKRKHPTYTKVGRYAYWTRTPPPPEPAPSPPPSLPLAEAEPNTPISLPISTSDKWARKLNLPADSVVRKKAGQILAMKVEGYDNDTIAKELHLSVRSLRQYLWLAGKNGWLKFVEPKDELEYSIAHKAVRNLDAMLDSENVEKVQMPATFKVADIVLGPQFDAQAPTGPNMNVLQINIQQPEGPAVQMREGTAAGIPAYVEAEAKEAT